MRDATVLQVFKEQLQQQIYRCIVDQVVSGSGHKAGSNWMYGDNNQQTTVEGAASQGDTCM